jgi:cell division transport system permease protein
MLKRADIPFSADDTQRFLPWLVALMVGLAVLWLSLAVTLGHWVGARNDTYNQNFTVNIPAEAMKSADSLANLEGTLRRTVGVKEVTRLSSAELRELLSPWLGAITDSDDLPLPAVYEVSLTKQAAAFDINALKSTLAAIIPTAQIDTQEAWASTFASFTGGLQWLTALLASIMIGAMVLIIIFSSRASLKLHSRTVQLLHSMGAEDSYIAGQFQQEVFVLSLRGALAGSFIALALYWLIGFYLGSLGSSLLPTLDLYNGHALLVVIMPVLCSGIAWFAARYCVMKQLEKVL